MSLNTAHLNGGVLIHNGEQILLYSDGVGIEWNGQQTTPFQGVKKGSIYLTTHRVIFLNKSSNDEMLSFSFPFITLSEVDIEQPVFGANYIKGKVRAQPNGNWIGEAKFKITFKHGGAIEFGQAMLRVAHLAINSDISGDASRGGMQAPPPYVPPQTQWYAAPPPAYAPPPQGYYGWTPPTNVFPQQPPSDGVFMTDAPPPYPGIVPGYQANGYGPPQGAGGFGGYPQGGPPSYPGTASGSSGYNQGAGGFQQPQFTNAAGAMVPYTGGATDLNVGVQPYQARAYQYSSQPYQYRSQPYQYRSQPYQYRSYHQSQARNINGRRWYDPYRRQG